MKKLALHWKILIGMALGVLFGLVMSYVGGGSQFVGDYIKPFGTIFINLLKLIAIPLILASLIKGVSDLKDISKLSQMGGSRNIYRFRRSGKPFPFKNRSKIKGSANKSGFITRPYRTVCIILELGLD